MGQSIQCTLHTQFGFSKYFGTFKKLLFIFAHGDYETKRYIIVPEGEKQKVLNCLVFNFRRGR